MGDCKFLRQKKQVQINGEWVDTRSYRYLPYCDGSTPSVIVKGGNPNGYVYVGFGKIGGSDHGKSKTISLDANGNGRINMESNDIINEVDINDNPSSCIVEIFSCNISSLGWGNNADAQKHSDKMSISCSRYHRISNQLFESMNFLGKTIKFNGFDTSKVTDMGSMFSRCRNITSLDLSGWDVSNVTDMFDMFSGCRSLTSLDLSGWNTSKVTDMSSMFSSCRSLTSLDVSGLDTSNVKYMVDMFQWCDSLTSLNLSSFVTSSVISMASMFYGCSSLTSLDLSSWDVSNVSNMVGMFDGCSGLTELNLSGWNPRNVTGMEGMFADCSSLTSLDLSGWITQPNTNMESMFAGCTNLTSLNLSGWSLSSVRIYGMFSGCSSLRTIYMRNCDAFDVAYVQEELKRCGIPLDQVTIIT